MSQSRLFGLLCLLLERGRMTAGELAEHFEVSVRTIYRDVDALSAAGVPVYAAPGRYGGVALLEESMANHHGNPDTGCQDMCGTMEASHTQEESVMNQTFCQSCGMPMDDPALWGTERDGTPSPHYCKYCYQEGAFTGDMTMEQMIDFCTPMMVQANPGMTEEQAKAQMRRLFPMLLRWRN